MPREQFQTLSEPMYYVLLTLTEERCGTDIMSEVAQISKDRVIVGPGTVYAMLDKFVSNGVIKQTKKDGRKRWYIITNYGKELLVDEHKRLRTLYLDGKALLEDEFKSA